MVYHDKGRRLTHRLAHEPIALVLRHHDQVVAPATACPILGPRLPYVLQHVAKWLGRGQREVLEVVPAQGRRRFAHQRRKQRLASHR